MTPALWALVGLWVGCLIEMWNDDFQALRRLWREMRRQWRWLPRLAHRVSLEARQQRAYARWLYRR